MSTASGSICLKLVWWENKSRRKKMTDRKTGAREGREKRAGG